MADDRTVPDLARLLRQLRRREARRRGGPELTYRKLAAETGWSLGIVAQYFSGRTLPPCDRLDVLVRLLGASPAEQGTLATARDTVDEHRRRRVPPAGPAPAGDRGGIRLLGPVEAAGPVGTARLVGVRQRALVGMLALNAGRVVARSRLVDALWGEDPPRTAVSTLYSHVARVRRALDACGLPGLLRSRESGYLLAVRPEAVDAARFERRVAQARAAADGGRPGEAVTHLEAGLALWRGDPLADAVVYGWAAADVERLHEVRLTALEDLWEIRLRTGAPAGAAGELEKLLVRRPGRERLVELLMLALYRSGRPVEAIAAYQRLRGQLADELGVEPGPAVRRRYTAILRRDPSLDPPAHRAGGQPTAGGQLTAPGQPSASNQPTAGGRGGGPAPTPAQLPPPAGHFTGRDRELAALDRLLDEPAQLGVVSGAAGMGKTALAVRWAHRAAGRFPDGQLFLDLRGHDPATALPVSEALAYLLAGLGVPPGQVPADLPAQVGLYRSALHQRRMLVLLDNAAGADQVSPLVPPSPTSVLVVTSRHRLAGLAVDHAVSTVDLGELPASDALVLLRRILGAGRVAGEPAAARELVALCGRLPLALRIAAAKLAARPGHRIAALTGELTADRLAALSVPGDSRSVRAVFAGAYRALRPAAAALFRRLGAHPGPTISAGLVAALPHQADPRSILDELVDAQLVVDAGADRYRFHDLIGVYARECAEPAEAVSATTRIIDWYLTVADRANRVFEPTRDRAGPVVADPPVAAPFPADHAHALGFLDAERDNLLPVTRHAAGNGHDRAVWRLAYLLTSYHCLRGHWPAQLEMCGLGLAAARRLADPAVEALMRSLLGVACNHVQRYDEALAQLGVALDLMRAAGDRRGQGKALNNRAFAYVRLGRYDEAADAFGRSLALHTADGHRPGIALALNNLGHTHTLKGRPDLADGYLSRALALARELDHRVLEALTLHSMGEARLAARDHDGALGRFAEALAIRRRTGERRLEADTLNLIGLTYRARGEADRAAAHFRQALILGRELGDRHLEATTLAYLADRAGAGGPRGEGTGGAGSAGADGDLGDRVDDPARRRPGDHDREPPARRAGRPR